MISSEFYVDRRTGVIFATVASLALLGASAPPDKPDQTCPGITHEDSGQESPSRSIKALTDFGAFTLGFLSEKCLARQRDETVGVDRKYGYVTIWLSRTVPTTVPGASRGYYSMRVSAKDHGQRNVRATDVAGYIITEAALTPDNTEVRAYIFDAGLGGRPGSWRVYQEETGTVSTVDDTASNFDPNVIKALTSQAAQVMADENAAKPVTH